MLFLTDDNDFAGDAQDITMEVCIVRGGFALSCFIQSHLPAHGLTLALHSLALNRQIGFACHPDRTSPQCISLSAWRHGRLGVAIREHRSDLTTGLVFFTPADALSAIWLAQEIKETTPQAG